MSNKRWYRLIDSTGRVGLLAICGDAKAADDAALAFWRIGFTATRIEESSVRTGEDGETQCRSRDESSVDSDSPVDRCATRG